MARRPKPLDKPASAITLLDTFAMAALPLAMSRFTLEESSPRNIAMMSYLLGEALLIERELSERDTAFAEEPNV